MDVQLPIAANGLMNVSRVENANAGVEKKKRG